MIRLDTYKAGTLQKGSNYEYFMPTTINDDWEWTDNSINLLLEKAAVKLGELNSYAKLVPSIDLFIQLHVTKEAVVSSKIEGTQTKMNEALLRQEDINPERRNDWQEVQNYITALNAAVLELESLPISTRLIRKTHKTLLASVRGDHKLPGEFRHSQNWIGGASLSNAKFIPPNHQHLEELMNDLEKFIHNQNISVPTLIRIAITHYQFETIHPFVDGNGRIGRLLITLNLISEGILEKPLLYLSTYFENNKSLYYEKLTSVRTRNDMKQWLKYFLSGIEETATQAVDTLNKILSLKTQMESTIAKDFGRRSISAHALLHQLFINPIVTIADVSMYSDLSFKAANDLVALMVQKQILKEQTGQSRNRIFVMYAYLDLFES